MSQKVLNKVSNDIFSYDTSGGAGVFKMSKFMPTEIHHATGGIGTSGYILTSTGTSGNGWTWSAPSGGGATDINSLTDAGATTNSLYVGAGSGISSTGNYNTFLGINSGNANTSGSDNTLIGVNAGFNNTTGGYSTIIGVNSGYNNNADYNVFIGYHAGFSNTTGTVNTFIGSNCGKYNVIGGYNAFYGINSGHKTTASHNTFIGINSGYNNVSGHDNTFVGTHSGHWSTGSQNTFLGGASGWNNTADCNTFIGYSSGNANTSGNNNTFVGWYAGNANNTGSNNTFMGMFAGAKSATSSSNVMIGVSAGYWNNTGADNVAIGLNAAANMKFDSTNPNYNVMVGGQAGYNNLGACENVYIGWSSGIQCHGNSNVFIGYNSASAALTNTNSIYIGNGCTAGSNSASDEIVIGASALGNGSNTITLGNAQHTGLYIPGLQTGAATGDVLTFDGTKIALAAGGGGGTLPSIYANSTIYKTGIGPSYTILNTFSSQISVGITSGATDLFTTPVAGWYLLSFSFDQRASSPANIFRYSYIIVLKNNVAIHEIVDNAPQSETEDARTKGGGFLVEMAANDSLAFATNANSGSYSVNGKASLVKVDTTAPAPAPSQTASFRATNSNTTNFTFSSGTQLFSTELNNVTGHRGSFNIGGAYNPNTGFFTAPEDGIYSFNGSVFWQTTSFNAGYIRVMITKPTLTTHGNALIHSQYGANEPFTDNFTQIASGVVSLVAGDTIGLYVFANGAPNANISRQYSYFSGHKIGTTGGASGSPYTAGTGIGVDAFNVISTDSTIVNTTSDQYIDGRKNFSDNVSIGLNAANGHSDWPLRVGGTGIPISGPLYNYAHDGSNGWGFHQGIYWTSHNPYYIGLFVDHGIRAARMYFMSDRRIKKDIVDMQDDEALRKLRTLKPKRYKYIDPRRGTQEVYGFIAQEVGEVIPYSVKTEKSFLPSHMCFCKITDIYEYTSVLNMNISHDLIVNDVLSFRNNKDIAIENVKVIEIIDDKTIKIDKVFTTSETILTAITGETENDMIYLYGKEIPDLHILNKDSIWTTATAALQEVDRQLQAEKIKNLNLTSRLEALEARITSLEAK